jgi:hypothetical protein
LLCVRVPGLLLVVVVAAAALTPSHGRWETAAAGVR